jgi:hypothetical protein
MFPLLSMSVVVSILCCLHAYRSGQDTFWFYIVLIFQPVGSIIYIAAVFVPELIGARGFRRLGKSVAGVLDPNRAYREATEAEAMTPSVHNRMVLAEAALGVGRPEEACRLYEMCATGVHTDDPTLLHRWSEALVEAGRHGEALARLEQLGDLGDIGRTPQAALLMARAQEGLGRLEDADHAYAWAAERLTGLEGLGRYIVFLVRNGERTKAEAVRETLEQRYKRIPRSFRSEAAEWRKLADATLAARVPDGAAAPTT